MIFTHDEYVKKNKTSEEVYFHKIYNMELRERYREGLSSEMRTNLKSLEEEQQKLIKTQQDLQRKIENNNGSDEIEKKLAITNELLEDSGYKISKILDVDLHSSEIIETNPKLKELYLANKESIDVINKYNEGFGHYIGYEKCGEMLDYLSESIKNKELAIIVENLLKKKNSLDKIVINKRVDSISIYQFAKSHPSFSDKAVLFADIEDNLKAMRTFFEQKDNPRIVRYLKCQQPIFQDDFRSKLVPVFLKEFPACETFVSR
jgi:hypothetical protein